jgi:hypothetical protein
MKVLFTLFLCALIVGCDATDEQAANNYNKGNKFFQLKEFEIAEYYYDKIPSTSPLYAQAQQRIQIVGDSLKALIPPEAQGPQGNVSQIQLLDYSYTLDNTGRVPTHRISLQNNSPAHLESVVLEFTYYDSAGNPIQILKEEVDTPLYPQVQDVFKNIRPGELKAPFASCTIRILSANFDD